MPDPAVPAQRRSASAQVFVEDLGRVAVSSADAHHLQRVLRLADGEPVVAANGFGGWRWCAFRRGGGLEPLGDPQFEARADPQITVAFAPVKGDRGEWVVQKLTELGVDHLVVLSTERSVVRWQGERSRRSLLRLAATARQAAGQSRRVWLPTISGIQTLPQLAGELDAGSLGMAEPEGGPPSLAHPAVAIGPEGGWAPAELSLDLPRIGLGPGVLRAETAAVAAGTLLCALRAGTVVSAMPSTPDHRTQQEQGSDR